MPEFCVALLTDPDDPFGKIVSQKQWDRSYSSREKVVVQAALEATLSSVLLDALSRFHLEPPEDQVFLPSVAFYRADDEHAMARRPQPRFLWGSISVVDRRGLLRPHVSLDKVTVEQLLRSNDAGVIDGDPLRPYLLVEGPYGDAPGFDWQALLTTLEAVRSVVQVIAEVGGTLAFGKLAVDAVAKRARRGEAALQRNWSEWTQQVDRPEQLLWLLQQREWLPNELARLLDSDPPDAKALMEVLGFAPAVNGGWTIAADDASALMTIVVDQLAAIYQRRYGQNMDEVLAEAIESLFRQGARASSNDSAEENEFWGVGRARREREPLSNWARRTPWLRVIARRTTRPPLSDLVAALIEIGHAVSIDEVDDGRLWTRASLSVGNDQVILQADFDDGNSEGLFAAEMSELADEQAYATHDERRRGQALIAACRMIIAVSGGPGENGRRVAQRLTEGLSVLCDGYIHGEDHGIASVSGELPGGWR